MKKTISTLLLALVCSTGFSQVKTPQSSPKSSITQVVGLTDVTIDYSRPSAKGRTVFGDLVPFGKLWRTGANANSIITFSDDVMIDNKTLKKGKYAIFTVPKADNWDIIFYTDTNNWGTPETLEESKVALRTTAKPQTLNNKIETFTIAMNHLDNNFGHLEISWEKTLVAVKIEVPTNKTAMASIENALNGPSAADYYAAGTYYFQSNGDMKKALEYVDKALTMNPNKPFWQLRQKSLIQAKLGDKKGAIETAKLSLAAAEEAKNNDYIKMNKDSIAEWSKK
ncbi:DUF2911 domain-containing protein [Flavobacterium sp.]|uniref:DUF2911 domain-containing protein n=1 Tax=Flavobacterium sp. TaxID=239 RepID=UPI0026263317|nr:DUF2911 domain-containing protein [Flavobacterium sp.]MDD3004912.1 DUF2911 domain-containing protein [Flavobacterium sp.]